jgi:hypothetical protein
MISAPADAARARTRDAGRDKRRCSTSRKVLWPILLIGLALVIAPLAMSLPKKANAGERMLNGFQPIMQPDSVKTTARYHYDVFAPLGGVVPLMTAQNVQRFQGYAQGLQGMQTDAAKLVPMLAQALNMTPAQVQQYMKTQLPAMSAMLQSLPQMQQDFGGLLAVMKQNVGIFQQVPGGLQHYKPLVDTMQGNVTNYEQVNSLPSFRLFAWFFIVPGALLILLSGWGLVSGRGARFTLHGARPSPIH